MGLADHSKAEEQDPAIVNQQALAALRAGDAKTARALLQAAATRHPNDVPLHLNLAAACRALDDQAGAMSAVDGALKADPRSFLALLMKASLHESQGRSDLAGAAYSTALTQAPPLERLDPATRKALDRARGVVATYNETLREFLQGAVKASAGGAGRTEAERLAVFVDRLTGRRGIYQQNPTHFAYPGLPAIEFYDRDLFSWLPALEAATGAIAAECLEAMRSGASQADFVPYVEYPDGIPLDQWAELNHSSRWSAYHLFKAGTPIAAHCDLCPNTLATLAALPQPQAPGRSPASMFSLLQPKTRIPPHTGVSNTRLVVHLPLVIPPGCGFKVGSETRDWRVGEAWVFDDTILHEAWNDSPEERAILIFDIWSPFLSEAERHAVVNVMNALDEFHGVAPEMGL